MGGQTALNTAMKLAANGALARHGVELIGAQAEVIDRAEDRLKFRDAMAEIGIESPRSAIAHIARRGARRARRGRPARGHPARASRSAAPAAASPTTGRNSSRSSPAASTPRPRTEVLIEECVLGWKEYEMEVVRDRADNCIIVCSIENVDPMGIHTGDSVTVAPALTLTDKEYQRMRDASIACLRKIGVDTGGSNVQFAVNPADGRMVIIEMNPRVSRSSALASKATGFPIAKIAAKLAVGYTLDELANDITARHAGELRADHRLRGGENPALHLREIPRHAGAADHHHEVGRRGDGDRPQLRRGAAERACAAWRPGCPASIRSSRPAMAGRMRSAPRCPPRAPTGC